MSLASPFRFLARALTFALAAVITVFAQTPSALDGFEPDFDGSVLAVASLPDGRILVGGQFTRAEELVVGVLMLMLGLYLEDWIDQWRSRRQR